MLKQHGENRSKHSIRKVIALTAAAALLNQNVAWAVCSDGGNFPPGGFGVGARASSWVTSSPPDFFTTNGSIFVPDNSTFESNNPSQPLTGGGHNWAFDQGQTLCKMVDTGPAGAKATAWAFPTGLSTTSCINLPIPNGTVLTAGADIPGYGTAITPTCNPGLLSTATTPNPNNTYFNQLGCSISHGVATTAKTATTFLFTAGVKSGLFNIPLTNVTNPAVGGEAGKVAAVPGDANWYSDIPNGQKLNAGAVSNDGRFVIATSLKQQQAIFACFNPLGDPGDPAAPINSNFIVPSARTVNCMSVGNNFLKVDQTTAFGPDNQPYFSGQKAVTTFNGTPGSSPLNPVPSAWPQCITQGTPFTIAQAFAAHSANHCGNAAPNGSFLGAILTEEWAIVTHGSYMYVGLEGGGTITQFKVTTDPISGLSQYKFRTYMTGGVGLTNGLGVADDIGSLLLYVNPNVPVRGVGGNIPETVTKLPLCEDF